MLISRRGRPRLFKGSGHDRSAPIGAVVVHVVGQSLYADLLARVARPPNASRLFALVLLDAVYLAVWLMSRRGWYLKF